MPSSVPTVVLHKLLLDCPDVQVPTHYGNNLYVWDWEQRKLVQEIHTGDKGTIPLEV